MKNKKTIKLEICFHILEILPEPENKTKTQSPYLENVSMR